MASMPLRVLTFNCWGLPDFISKLAYNKDLLRKVKLPRQRRFQAIGTKLKEYDIVCLQEVWLPWDQKAMLEMGDNAGLIYSHVYSSGMLGSNGLVLLSRFPIQDVFFHRFRVNGQVYRVDHGDYHAGKGIAYARIATTGGPVVVFFTHTIAKYSLTNDVYQADRIAQMWELARFVQLTTANDTDSLVLVGGDLNVTPATLEYALLEHVADLQDAYW